VEHLLDDPAEGPVPVLAGEQPGDRRRRGQARPEDPRVLLVDDSEAVREVYARMLGHLGLAVGEADGAHAALAAYARARPAAVFLDVAMPGADGLEALRALRAFDPDARVALLTARRDEATVLAALSAGTRDYLVKPINLTRLREAMGRLLA
jgi:two-component system chemotaxis response regulator CheY